MNAPNQAIAPEYTPDEMAALYAKHKSLFTVEDLLGYIEDAEPIFPIEEVLAEVEDLMSLEEANRQVRA